MRRFQSARRSEHHDSDSLCITVDPIDSLIELLTLLGRSGLAPTKLGTKREDPTNTPPASVLLEYIALSYLRMFPIKPLRYIVVLFRYPLLSLLLSSEEYVLSLYLT